MLKRHPVFFMAFKKGHKGFLTKEHYEKMSKDRKGKAPKNIDSIKYFWLGKKRSVEDREKMSKAKIGKPNLALRKDTHKIDESKVWRKRFEYRLWREAVYKRDNFTCHKCKVSGGRLHPHHIRNFAEVIELRFAIDNGITLCIGCHRDFHKRYGKKNNTKEQIKEFLNYV